VDLEIFGMEGVPQDAINAKQRGDEGKILFAAILTC
jgi:hypothetical protein